MKKFIHKYGKFVFLAILLYLPIFSHLDSTCIRIWDESRLTLNAFSMYKDHNFLVTHCYGERDMWNLKPPLMIWFQVLFMHIIGPSELAVRLPSAFAAVFTCIAIFLFCKKSFGDDTLGFISVLILITSGGYIEDHASRTGDYDAMLALFTTLSSFSFYRYCTDNSNSTSNNILYFFLFLGLGVLTKSIAGLFFCPGLLIFALINKKIIPIFKDRKFYIGLGLFLVMVLGYYFLRDYYNPGYIKKVLDYEFAAHYLNTVEDHNHGFWFYLELLINNHYSEWIITLSLALFLGFFLKNIKLKSIFIFNVVLIFSYLLLISSANTKLEWYDVPLYPIFAIIIGIFIYTLFTLLI